ncbi:4-hydroxy-tetrahydrodipicolinate synthase [Maledivibacter halophilus]|uniref:4-hydroxy-tetrahydrodipicolinate synthase n=1 Tax=Maledivibacter halophilus TaxID=36842 RepID=A0A1T5M8S8_9FIRM|nr:4-hydroxy-tetrahydrodipicolinate synthase [Maledivibacter halophilus]SKC84503.1 4-hydroxy-tetrahydrodipicolinate synthase [Maledivibacter halophilus]
MKFKGVYSVVVTPFDEKGKFDFEAMKKNVDYLIESGIHGLCVLGATSEYLSVSTKEYKEILEAIIPYIDGRVPVAVGASRERSEDVVELINIAEAAGAQIAMVLPPYYCHPSQGEIFEHFKYITENTNLPLIVYNNPGSAGVNIEKETFEKLFTLPKIAVVKDSTGDISELTKLQIIAREDVSVFCGSDCLPYESFAIGADGWISMLSNVAPKNCVALYDLINNNKREEAFELYKKMLPALYLLEEYGKPTQILKYLLDVKGLKGGYSRRPRRELSESEKKYILKQVDLEVLK